MISKSLKYFYFIYYLIITYDNKLSVEWNLLPKSELVLLSPHYSVNYTDEQNSAYPTIQLIHLPGTIKIVCSHESTSFIKIKFLINWSIKLVKLHFKK